ncbi:zinc finger E-box-binding homeobox 1 [Lampris incognitus]|uniref:zinc finger E-box-binding homeobox 1 n=1 Tax=Lampris incognitus TaxID=2546036 RepID=UPI0024B54BF3|nr:zinc finger E-box-binding homeobox 1 [Lampris incognitus]
MADGPRCKRRKQANPRRTSVTNFNNGLEASSDSDDEDKLHIVEEDSLQEPDVADGDKATPGDSHDATTVVLTQNGSWNGVKGEAASEEDEEEEEVKSALVEEILQQGDTAIIYPEAPEEEQSTLETGVADENGTPDTFSQLHTCPYCSRGYKRNASLKEHIKYRHETSEDNFSCSHCSYTFTYRSQLERHMSHHRGTREQRHVTPVAGGNRKFKCTECAKAFKYKHHLKEHLRIHSGEKPYECANCKKRFSHSGSYSSHISSKKCVGALPPNGNPRPPIKPAPPSDQPAPVVIAPARMVLKEKTDSKPLQEQLPVTQIKSEPVEYECKPVTVAPAPAPAPMTGTNGVVNGGVGQGTVATAAALPQGVAMVVPTMGLVSPISINLSDLQNVLKVAMDGNVFRQVLGTANGVVTQGKQGIVVQQPQQQIISLPAFVDQDGTTKIIINYSINTAATATPAAMQPTPLLLKKDVPPAPTAPTSTVAATNTNPASTPTKTVEPLTSEGERTATDLTVIKTEKEAEPVVTAETDAIAKPEKANVTPANSKVAETSKDKSTSACLLCDNCPDSLDALHLLQHRKAANGEAVDSDALDPSFAALLKEAGVTLEEPPMDDLSLLKTYFASNANPKEDELEKISKSISIPVDVVRKWFVKMNSGKINITPPKDSTTDSRKTPPTNSSPEVTSNHNIETEKGTTSISQAQNTPIKLPSESSIVPSDPTPLNLTTLDLVTVKSEPEDPEDQDTQAEPLDLSLPKQISAGSDTQRTPPPVNQQEQPLNLSCLRKEQVQGNAILVTSPQTGSPVNIVTTAQLPTLVAIASQGTVGCLSAINTTAKRTILIPQLTYTYTTTAGSTPGAMTVVLNGHKEKKQDSGSEGMSAVEEQNNSDSASPPKKRRLENGVYPCDLCDKVFQKGSSLLRHKYEHTGKRPHECSVCKKAFKHKHHLIEHSRLHSGEKPYQCDKCGKRFSHSGSFSQHMNHRYSYCKKDGTGTGSSSVPRKALSEAGGGLQPDSRTTTPPSQVDSDERESEEDEEDDDDEAMCMDDIRVVQVDDEECEIFESNFDEDGEEAEAGLEGEGGDEAGEAADEETSKTEEGEAEVKEEGAIVCEVVEVELEAEQEEMEEEVEEEEAVECKDTIEMLDNETNADGDIREGSDKAELTADDVTKSD